MPLPSPQKGQTEQEFISSCMSSETMRKEWSNSKQRYAVCQSILKRSRKSKATKDNPLNWKEHEDSPTIVT